MEFALVERLLWADREEHDSAPPDVVAAIEGAHLVLEWLGAWPSFEDFEVISLDLGRGNLMSVFETKEWSDSISPNLTAAFYGFDIRYSSGDLKRKPMLITMRFNGIVRFSLDGFNHQNPICGLEIVFEYSESLKTNLFAVAWGGTCLRHGASFTCQRVEVVALEALVDGT